MDNRQALALFRKLDHDKNRSVSIDEWILGIEAVYDSELFRVPSHDEVYHVNEKIYAKHYYISFNRDLVQTIRLIVLLVEMMSLTMLSRGVSSESPSSKIRFDENRKQQAMLELMVFGCLLFYICDMFVHIAVLFSGNLLAYFNPTLFVGSYWAKQVKPHLSPEYAVRKMEREAQRDQVRHSLDFLLMIYCVFAHIIVMIAGAINAGTNDSAPNWQRVLFPWHSFTMDETIVQQSFNITTYQRVWMSISIFRFLLILDLPRRIVFALIHSFRKMMPLFLLIFVFLYIFATIGVCMFRDNAIYQDKNIFADMGSAFTAFSQLQIGEAFFEILYESIVWRKAWRYGVIYNIVYHFVMVFFIGDLFFGLLLSVIEDLFSEEPCDDEDDDDDEEEEDVSAASDETPVAGGLLGDDDDDHDYARQTEKLSIGGRVVSLSEATNARRRSSDERRHQMEELKHLVDYRDDPTMLDGASGEIPVDLQDL